MSLPSEDPVASYACTNTECEMLDVLCFAYILPAREPWCGFCGRITEERPLMP